ncbi:hypothetical protein BLL37_08320 [Pseudomonas azotoformans]|uniref:Methyl-accepting chemotaxis protein n=1 Tax=Pseudomonas azotoformans TaxID=47878 RepID=A0A1V2JNC0_PSEAZ|nr:hypothetical protein BFL39_17655 [Pseudomonas azotoformans]ONH46863.1 hypothetical protein BLL37_08320 [Pseudomonas azotoformans]
MNIKQKLILAFAVIASLPVILVAVLIILNVRHEARDGFRYRRTDQPLGPQRRPRRCAGPWFRGLIHETVDVIRNMSTQIATAAEEQHKMAEDINRISARFTGMRSS